MAQTLSMKDLAENIGEHLYPPAPDAAHDHLALIKRFVAMVMKLGPRDPDLRRYAPRIACHLAALAENHKSEISLKALLGGLLFAGRLGRVLTCRLIRDKGLDLKKIAPMVDPLPARCRLFLLQELLREPDLENRALMQWAKEMLEPMAETDHKEILAFLEDLSAEGDEPCHLVRRTILRGSFPDWLIRTLERTRDRDRRNRLYRAVSVLQGQELTDRIAMSFLAHPSSLAGEDLTLLLSGGASDFASLDLLLHDALAKHGPEVGLAALDSMLLRSMPKTGQAFLTLYKRHPSLRAPLARRLMLLDGSARAGVLKALKGKPAAAAVLRGYAAFAEVETGFARTCLNRPPEMGEEAKAKAKSFLVKRQRAGLSGIRRLEIPEPPTSPAQSPKKGLLSRLVTDKPADLAEVLEGTPNPKDLDLTGASLTDTAVTARNMTRLKLKHAAFSKVQFIRVSFVGVDFTSAFLDQADFTGCTFTNCSFASTHLRLTTFQDCEFNKCPFSGAALDNTAFSHCSLRLCPFTDVALRDSELLRTRLTHCPLEGCHFSKGGLYSSAFRECVLHGCLLEGVELRGVEWDGCGLEGCVFLDCPAYSLASPRTTAVDLTMRSTLPDSSVLARARVENIHRRVAALDDAPIPKSLAGPDVRPALVKAVDRFGLHLQTARAEAGMRTHNARRTSMCLRRMAGPDFFRLLPCLLHTDVFDRHRNLSATTGCRIAGYTPDFSTLELAGQWFPDAGPNPSGHGGMVIEALFAMGSVGTVAQTEASDLDCWVCYDGSGVSEDQLAGLKRKLEALSQWAADEFGLEAVFFPMSLDDVRANRFGFSDKESSGSAQARMLKEEFYRTAILLAGGAPMWWAVPPGSSLKTYQKTAARLADDLLYPEERFVDMGHASQVPPQEFFGAALWQIVKAIKSPYKSVLKLGLLEKYASAPSDLLLCDQIKHNVLAGRRDVESTDPYSALYLALRAHYAQADDRDAIQLLTESLLLKSDVGAVNLLFGFPAFPDEAGLIGFLFNRNDPAPPSLRKLARTWSFAKTMLLGSTVNRFMTNSYKRIRAQRTGDGDAAITPEDMTRLGRHIAANFGRKKDKVMRVPFLGLTGFTYTTLRFSANRQPGRPPEWTVQGGAEATRTMAVRNMEPLQKGGDLAALLAWLVVNRVFSPNCLVDGERTIAPMAIADLNKSLSELQELLPPEEVFEIDPADYLGPEQITRACFLLNLLAPRDARSVVQVSVVYATTFGEVFCISRNDPGPGLERSARAFLRTATGLEVQETALLKAFRPRGAQCKRFALV